MTTRIVLAHGFTQTARSWTTFRRLLADRGYPDTVAVDMPGHGEATELAHDLVQSAAHLVATGGSGTYIGYSMGGRVALHAALEHPAAVHRLVLISATAGIDDDDERAAREAADHELAGRIESIGVRQFVDEWLGSPLFAHLGEHEAQRDDRLRNTATGLATSLRMAGTGTQRPLWGRLAEIDVPALVVVGERDAKYRRLGERLRDGLPHGELRVIQGAGHSAHLEQPRSTADAVCDWLTATA